MLELLLSLLITPAHAEPALAICHGEYALCAASSAQPTGRTIVVNGKMFKEGVSVCPVLHGSAIADLNLMNGSCDSPKGKVWSLFEPRKNYPQAPTWETLPAVQRTFTTTSGAGGMSNMWSFPCVKRAHRVNGVQLADCYGPLNESPWTGSDVPVGTNVVTDAPVGASYPVGGTIPNQ
jgi:hypothetical protein